jgi:hypothetical protein
MTYVDDNDNEAVFGPWSSNSKDHNGRILRLNGPLSMSTCISTRPKHWSDDENSHEVMVIGEDMVENEEGENLEIVKLKKRKGRGPEAKDDMDGSDSKLGPGFSRLDGSDISINPTLETTYTSWGN